MFAAAEAELYSRYGYLELFQCFKAALTFSFLFFSYGIWISRDLICQVQLKKILKWGFTDSEKVSEIFLQFCES